jgi:tetratricopeptide (TPR) repeat protein
MGLLDKLFGRGKQAEEAARRQAIAAKLRAATSEPYSGEARLAALDACFPDPSNFDDVLEGINALFEADRIEWAEALARRSANHPKCPAPVRKGLLRHFVADKRGAEVLEGLLLFIDERPSDSDMAIEAGHLLLTAGEHQRVVESMQEPLKASPESMQLFAIAGEAYLKLERWADATEHLRTSCELYEAAFRHGSIVAAEMNTEQLEFSRLYGLLEQAARQHLGPASYRQAFEKITMEPGAFSIVREAERLAARRIEYKPWSPELPPADETGEALADEHGVDELDVAARLLLYRGMGELRHGRHEAAMRTFRETLERDVESYAAYLGWAACEGLLRLEPLAGADKGAPAEAAAMLAPVLPDWANFTPREQFLAAAVFGRIRNFLPRMAAAGAVARVHPLDVRLTDLYPQRTELRFDRDDCPPQGLGAFAARFKAHVRLDEFLVPDPDGWSFARMAGYLVCDCLNADELAEVRRLVEEARKLTGKASAASTPGPFLALIMEALVLRHLHGSNPEHEVHNDWARIGAFDFVESLKA